MSKRSGETRGSAAVFLLLLACACEPVGEPMDESVTDSDSGGTVTPPTKEEAADAFCTVTETCADEPGFPSVTDCYNFYLSIEREDACQTITNLLMVCIGSLSCEELETYSSKDVGYPCADELRDAEPCGW